MHVIIMEIGIDLLVCFRLVVVVVRPIIRSSFFPTNFSLDMKISPRSSFSSSLQSVQKYTCHCCCRSSFAIFSRAALSLNRNKNTQIAEKQKLIITSVFFATFTYFELVKVDSILWNIKPSSLCLEMHTFMQLLCFHVKNKTIDILCNDILENCNLKTLLFPSQPEISVGFSLIYSIFIREVCITIAL